MSDEWLVEKADLCLQEATQLAARLLLDLHYMKYSPQTVERCAYRDIHELIGALAGAHTLLDLANGPGGGPEDPSPADHTAA